MNNMNNMKNMKNLRRFYHCKKCGNVMELIGEAGEKVLCCGDEMSLLVANSTDAAQEKHIPVATWNSRDLTVTVSSVIHPMTNEHHIAWVAIIQGDKIQRVDLEKTGQPIAEFKVDEGPITMLEYCNLHGLWVAETI